MYKNGNDFLWPALRTKAAEQGLPLRTVLAEVMQITALDALFALPESQHMCFQGGTCIHLLHGGYRYSEDLDFAGSSLDRESSQNIITTSQSSVEKGMVQLLGPGESEWKTPREKPDARVFSYWYLFRPRGSRIRYRLKIEFGRYPVYEPKTFPVMSNLDLLQKRTLVRGATPKELFIEKVIAVIGRSYLKGRDLFDIWYLDKILRAPRDPALAAKKLQDYGERPDLEPVEEKLRNAPSSLVADEMGRFVPQPYRERLGASGYREIREHALEAVKSVLDSLREIK